MLRNAKAKDKNGEMRNNVGTTHARQKSPPSLTGTGELSVGDEKRRPMVDRRKVDETVFNAFILTRN